MVIEMSESVQNSLRLYQVLKWIDAVENGYKDFRGKEQIVTTGNVAGFWLEENVMESTLKANYGALYFSGDEKRDSYNHLRQHLSNLFKRYRARSLIARVGKLKKSEENSWDLRERVNSRRSKVWTYKLTETGRERMKSAEKLFDHRRELAGRASRSIPEDVVVVPVEKTMGWELETVSVPRIENGRLMDSGEVVLS